MDGREQIQVILQSGRFSELFGWAENDWLEFKVALYDFENDLQCHELAKDVSALANAGGGVIIVGAGTVRQDNSSGDVVDRVRPFSRSLVNVQKYEGTIAGRTFPPIRGVSIKWMPDAKDSEKGLLVITVPDFQEYRPVLVQNVFVEGRKTAGNVFGYFERKSANADHYGIQQLHTLIQNGARFSSLDARLDSLTDAVNSLLQRDLVTETSEKVQTMPFQLSPHVLKGRIEALLNGAGLEGKPSFTLAAVPTSITNIPSLTLSTGQARELIQSPPCLRSSGFDLGTYENAPLIGRGQARRAIIPDYKALECWSDGTFLFVATADEEFLSWHTRPKEGQAFLINTLVLAEVTYLFCETVRRMTELMNPVPEALNYVLQVRRLDAPGKLAILRPQKVSEIPACSLRPITSAPYSGEFFSFFAPTDQVPEETAFQYLREFYLWFGIEEDRIPYTDVESGHRRISVKELK